jgi:hypothetical protein
MKKEEKEIPNTHTQTYYLSLSLKLFLGSIHIFFSFRNHHHQTHKIMSNFLLHTSKLAN